MDYEETGMGHLFGVNCSLLSLTDNSFACINNLVRMNASANSMTQIIAESELYLTGD